MDSGPAGMEGDSKRGETKSNKAINDDVKAYCEIIIQSKNIQSIPT